MRRGISCIYSGIDKRTLRRTTPQVSRTQLSSYTKETSIDKKKVLKLEESEKSLSDQYYADNHKNSSLDNSNNDGDWLRSLSYNLEAKKNTLNRVELRLEEEGITDFEMNIKNSYKEGKFSFLIPDSMGTLRYVGETSPQSLLYEIRLLFLRAKGPTSFTDILKKCPIEDRPSNIDRMATSFPSREVVEIYVDNFVKNINNTFFILDMENFRSDVIEAMFKGVYVDNKNMTLLYLILALGSSYMDCPKIFDSNSNIMYLNKGNILLRENIINDGLWLSQAYLLNYFFYQHAGKSLTSWIYLGIAIKYGQAFGIHRNFINEQFSGRDGSIMKKKLFRTLYICDRISSVFLGRPLSINDYDYSEYEVGNKKDIFDERCQNEMLKICHIIGRVIDMIYCSSNINIDKTKGLVNELELWSRNLSKDLKVNRILDWTNNCDIFLNSWTKYNLVLMHLLQLFAIMLLSRPFFMYEASSHFNNNITIPDIDAHITNRLYNASVEAAILSIRLIYHYINTDSTRVELYVFVQCCLYAILILGLRLLESNEGLQSYEDYRNIIRMGILVLNIYSSTSNLASRFLEIFGRMLEALSDMNKEGLPPSFDIYDSQIPINLDLQLFDDIDFVTSHNYTVETLMDFQDSFASFSPIRVIPHASQEDTSNSSYISNSYSLFLGDKC